MPSYPTYPLLTLAIVAATLLIQPVPNHAQSVGAIPTESPTIIGPTAVNIERVEPAARIAGLGWGMFLCLAVGVAFLVICILLSQHPLARYVFLKVCHQFRFVKHCHLIKICCQSTLCGCSHFGRDFDCNTERVAKSISRIHSQNPRFSEFKIPPHVQSSSVTSTNHDSWIIRTSRGLHSHFSRC